MNIFKGLLTALAIVFISFVSSLVFINTVANMIGFSVLMKLKTNAFTSKTKLTLWKWLGVKIAQTGQIAKLAKNSQQKDCPAVEVELSSLHRISFVGMVKERLLSDGHEKGYLFTGQTSSAAGNSS